MWLAHLKMINAWLIYAFESGGIVRPRYEFIRFNFSFLSILNTHNPIKLGNGTKMASQHDYLIHSYRCHCKKGTVNVKHYIQKS